MLKIGSFSRIAGVSIRLLHYYEELGLFYPAYIDSSTGYRYYQMEQVKKLNKIIALKDLGLTLHEIKQYVVDEISKDELKGMLKLKQSQVYNSIEAELIRLRRIEYRLQQLDSDSESLTEDVIIKEVPAQHYISMRNRQLPINQFMDFVDTSIHSLPAHYQGTPGVLTVLEHSEAFPETYFDLEAGYAFPSDNDKLAELPFTRQMATLLHVGGWGTGMNSYIALGLWIEQHGFDVAGATREVYMEFATMPEGKNVVEFQLPIQPSERIIP